MSSWLGQEIKSVRGQDPTSMMSTILRFALMLVHQIEAALIDVFAHFGLVDPSSDLTDHSEYFLPLLLNPEPSSSETPTSHTSLSLPNQLV